MGFSLDPWTTITDVSIRGDYDDPLVSRKDDPSHLIDFLRLELGHQRRFKDVSDLFDVPAIIQPIVYRIRVVAFAHSQSGLHDLKTKGGVENLEIIELDPDLTIANHPCVAG